MKYALALWVLLLSGCFAGGSGAAMKSVQAAEEPLHSVVVKAGQIEVGVISRGCTRRQDFEVVWKEPNRLTVVRLRPDHCRRMPFVKQLVLALPKAGDGWVVTNPLVAAPHKRPGKPPSQ